MSRQVEVIERDEQGGPFYIGTFKTSPDDDEPLQLFVGETPIALANHDLMKSLNAVMRGFGAWRGPFRPIG